MAICLEKYIGGCFGWEKGLPCIFWKENMGQKDVRGMGWEGIKNQGEHWNSNKQ